MGRAAPSQQPSRGDPDIGRQTPLDHALIERKHYGIVDSLESVQPLGDGHPMVEHGGVRQLSLRQQPELGAKALLAAPAVERCVPILPAHPQVLPHQRVPGDRGELLFPVTFRAHMLHSQASAAPPAIQSPV